MISRTAIKKRNCNASARCRVTLGVLALAICLPVCQNTAAHGDPGKHIDAITQQLAADTDNTQLLIERGKLLRLDGHNGEALADFETVAAQTNPPHEVYYQLGVTLLLLDRAKQARSHLERYVAGNPNDVKARAALANALAQTGAPVAAASEYTRVIAASPLPEHYLDRAAALDAAGETAAAIAGIDEGLAALGKLVSLQRIALSLELKRNNIKGALQRIDALAEMTGRADLWLAQRGDVLLGAERKPEAKSAYAAALAAINALPGRRQRSTEVIELRHRVNAALLSLSAESDASTRRGAIVAD